MESEKIEFRSLLRALRIRKGPTWKQPVMADALGFSHRLYVAWENGESVPSVKKLRRIADYFKLDKEDEEELYRAAAQAPPRIHNLPFSQNPFFTGREMHLEQLGKHLQETGTVEITQSVSISGLGGIGKTQLALEYAYSHYPKVYLTVLWVNASDGAMIQASYDSIASLLELQESDERELDKRVQAVKRWLETHTNWLLIMDNADDLQLARSFLPVKPLGNVVFTTRSQIVRDSNIAIQIKVEEMTSEEGLFFLLRRSGMIQDETTLDAVGSKVREAAQQLVELLGRHPLALDQAGAYIEETGVSVADYIQLYQEENSFLLDKGGPPGNSYHPETVVATVRLSFRKTCMLYPAVEEVLYFCSFLQPDAMPEEVFYQADSLKLDAKSFNAVVVALRRYSLIKRNAQEKILSMHRLVQAILGDGMSIEDRKLWRERVMRTVHAAFPDVDFKDWKQCGRLLPHALVCATWTEEELTPTVEVSDLFHRAGTYLDERAQYTEAEQVLTRAISIRERYLGPDHPDTAQSLNNLGWLYDHLGKYAQAESVHQRALKMREKQLGHEHPATAQSLNNLGVLYRHQLKYEDAEPLHRRALTIREKQLGAKHVDTAESLNNLGLLYSDMKKYEDAEPMLQRGLAVREKLLGKEHPDIAESLNNLAFLYDFQEKYAASEPMHRRALAIREKHLGPDHPNVAQSLTNLAWLCDKLKRYDEAEQLFQRTLAIDTKTCGPEHPYVADDLYNLAVLYDNQRKHKQAETFYLQALAIQKRQLGATHQYTKETIRKYAKLLREMGCDAKAVALERNNEPSV